VIIAEHRARKRWVEVGKSGNDPTREEEIRLLRLGEKRKKIDKTPTSRSITKGSRERGGGSTVWRGSSFEGRAPRRQGWRGWPDNREKRRTSQSEEKGGLRRSLPKFASTEGIKRGTPAKDNRNEKTPPRSPGREICGDAPKSQSSINSRGGTLTRPKKTPSRLQVKEKHERMKTRITSFNITCNTAT